MTHRLSRDQRILVHQVYPLKLAFDIGGSLVSLVLLWQHRLVSGLVVHYLAPVIGSAIVLRIVDVDQLAETPAGRYVLQHMPPPMVALRLAGDTLMEVAAWRRQPEYIVLGVLVVLLGWSHGLLVKARLVR